ncbi:MAG TPA: hypothetical protein VGV15_14935 [Terriglobales bacterium]|nr:hypothetical protein [Terriglobales bacterium]
MRYLVAVSLLSFLISPALAENRGNASDTLNQKSGAPDAWGIISPSAPDDVNAAFARTERDAQPTCLKMRSYYVERESKHSDVTHPIGYSTCTPSERFAVKRAEDNREK